MLEKPQLVQTRDLPIAYIAITVPREQVTQVMGPGIDELIQTLAEQGIRPSGPWLTHHLRLDDHVFDFQICFPVPKKVDETGRVQNGILSATRAVHATYTGPFDGLANAWTALQKQITAEGLVKTERFWEIYTVGPESGRDPSEWRTDLFQAVL